MQKYQYFVSQGGVAIYYDHERGPMWVPMLSTTQEILEEKYETTCTKICGDGSKKLVFLVVDGLQYCVVCADKNETAGSLRKLLYLFSDLLAFRIHVPKQSLYNRSINQNETQRLLRPLVRTMTKLSQTNQSVLVQGIEFVELNDYNRNFILGELENAAKICSGLAHAILFVGTKVAGIYSKPKCWALHPKDILCTMIYAQSVFADDMEENIPTTKYDKLRFHISKYGRSECDVYMEHLKDENITLVLICQDTNPKYDAELMQAASHVKRELMSVTAFLAVKAEEAHITMLHFLHYCPGLIHFILIDRITNRVIAPRIISLNSISSFGENTEQTNVTVEYIKSKVWDMCHITQDYKEMGYTQMGVCSTDIQYWYKEWMEDDQGNEITNPNNTTGIQLWKNQTLKKHYELYSMYLPFICTSAVAKYNKILLQLLLETVK